MSIEAMNQRLLYEIARSLRLNGLSLSELLLSAIIINIKIILCSVIYFENIIL